MKLDIRGLSPVIPGTGKFNIDITAIPKMERDEDHVYTTPEGNRYRSVTTMINKTKDKNTLKNFSNWDKSFTMYAEGHPLIANQISKSIATFIKDQTGMIGTEAHRLNEEYMKGNECRTALLFAQAHHMQFREHLDEYLGTINGIEALMYSDKMKLAGTADLIAEYDGVKSIIDFKCKRSNQRAVYMHDYMIQTACYARMWEELTKEHITQTVILCSTEENTFHVFKSDTIDWQDKVNMRLNQFNQYLIQKDIDDEYK